MKKLPLGTRVRLSEMGMSRYQNNKCNPHDKGGRVLDNDYDYETGMCYQVKWSNGETNCYYPSDLKALPQLEENE